MTAHRLDSAPWASALDLFRRSGAAVLCAGLAALILATKLNRTPVMQCDPPAWRGAVFKEIAPAFGVSVPREGRCLGVKS